MRRRLSLVLSLALVLALAVPALAGGPSVDQSGNELSELVFVELSGRPLADHPGGLQAIRSEQAAFRKDLKAAGIRAVERYQYQTLFNGFSLLVAPSDMDRLQSLPGVKNIWPVVELPRPELLSSPDMIRAPEVYDELGYDGTGVLVAVIDTGIDYNHPDLGGGFGPGCRVIGGWDFVGPNFNPDEGNITPEPDDDPMDEYGHGTHVAGIIGANGEVRGVAPGVGFLALKVFGPAGPTYADIMLAAMEMALEEGADVVNMSIGSAYQWPAYPTAAGADRLVNRGVVVVCSQGNNGPQGLFGGGAPGVGSKVISVGAFENTHVTLPYFELPDGTPVGYRTMTFSVPMPTEGESPEVVYAGLGGVSDFEGLDVEGKVALMQRGSFSFAEKAANAETSGAACALIFNNAPGFFSGTLGEPGVVDIPTAGLSLEGGQQILAALAEGPVTLTWTDQLDSFPNAVGGQVASFSSWGPSPDLAIKPDVSAPGASIYSTYLMSQGGYATMSGTSMSSPHVAGAAALLLEAYPRLNPNALSDMLRNTAVPQVLIGAYLLPVHRQGAGMVDVFSAVTAGARVEPSKVSLGELNGPTSFTVTVENKRSTAVTYALSHAPALATDHTITAPGQYAVYAELDIPETIAVGAGKTKKVKVGVVPPDVDVEILLGGYLVLTPDDGGPVLRVPYLGFLGDYQEKTVLHDNAYDFPWLARLEGTTYYKMTGYEWPTHGETAYVLMNLARQASIVRLDVYEASTGRSMGRVLDGRFYPRNSGPAAFFALGWDATGRKGPVPPGEYVLHLSVLKPLGDDKNPDHWETWTSGVIKILDVEQ